MEVKMGRAIKRFMDGYKKRVGDAFGDDFKEGDIKLYFDGKRNWPAKLIEKVNGGGL